MQPYVEALLNHRNGTLQPYVDIKIRWRQIAEDRNRTRAQADHERPPSRSSIYMFAQRYASADLDIRALLPDFQARGNRKARIDTRLNEILDELIEAIYLTPEARTKAALVAACMRHVEALNSAIGQPDAELIEPLPLPTRRMIVRRADQVEKFDLAYYRKDPIKAQNAHLPIGVGPVATRINQRWELDSSTLDVHVVEKQTGARLGRPTLTAVIDCASRLIVGWKISFEGESTLQLMLTLRHAISPKRLNHINIKCPHPGRGIPEGIWMDNGEAHHSDSLKDALNLLHITPYWLPPKRPKLRGKIERWFRSLNLGLIHNIRGTTKSNPKQSEDYDSEDEAVFTLEEIDWLITFWICDVYNTREHRATRRSPIGLWAEMAQEFPPVMPGHAEDLNVLLTRLSKRSVTAKGIEIRGLLYNDYTLALLRNRPDYDPKDLKIRIDEADIGHIYVLGTGMTHYARIPCTNQRYAAGKTVYQHQAVMAHAKKLADKDRQLTEHDFEKAWGELILAGNTLMQTKGRRKTLHRLGRFFAIGIKPVQAPQPSNADHDDGDEDYEFDSFAQGPKPMSSVEASPVPTPPTPRDPEPSTAQPTAITTEHISAAVQKRLQTRRSPPKGKRPGSRPRRVPDENTRSAASKKPQPAATIATVAAAGNPVDPRFESAANDSSRSFKLMEVDYD
ncbi:Mu transposase C-terminal domain-containing protein [Bosea thiooxidans]